MKFVKIVSATTFVVIALAVLGVTMAFAQQPTENSWWTSMRNRMQANGSRGMVSGNWESMQQMHNQMTQGGGMNVMHEWMHQPGGVHDTVWKALAEKLGLTADELTGQVNDGKTLAQVAEEKGVAVKDLAAIMKDGMKAGLEQAVKDGKLTQDQADLMLKNMDGQYEWMITNMGAGMMNGGGMMNPSSGGMMNPSSGGMMNPSSGGMMGPGAGGCHDNDDTSTQGSDL